MLQSHNRETPQRIGFLLLPRFSMMCLLSAVEPLRGANRTLGHEAYRWVFLSVDGAPVEASNGMSIRVERGIDQADDLPAVAVVASYAPMAAVNDDLLHWLRYRHRRGCDLGAFETGTWVLAAAGVLKDRRVTLHWETLAAFREAHLDIDARDTLFEIDGPIFTCSGGTAAMDLMLHLVGRHHSRALAASVAEQFLHGAIRPANTHQRMAADHHAGIAVPELNRATELMRAHIETPLRLDELAQRCGIGKRRLVRLFCRHLGVPPQRHYLQLRLERARHLLRHAPLPIHEVALACGFGSASWFTRAYRAHFGHTPRMERRRGDR